MVDTDCQIETAATTAIAPRWCADFDEDCRAVPDKVICSRLDPDQGACVYLCGGEQP